MHKLIDFINQNVSLDDTYLEIFGRRLPTGKFQCPNPEHQHINNTPSCKRYGNVFKCFGQCNRIFGVYDLLKWYNPKKIDEYKAVLLPDTTERQPQQFRKIQVSATTISEALTQITGVCL